jgi:hypothetical protein
MKATIVCSTKTKLALSDLPSEFNRQHTAVSFGLDLLMICFEVVNNFTRVYA